MIRCMKLNDIVNRAMDNKFVKNKNMCVSKITRKPVVAWLTAFFY